MMNSKRRRATLCALAVVLVTCGALPVGAQLPRYVVVSEGTLRKYAVKTILPEYPEPARRHNTQGVAVAQLDVDAQGLVTQTEVLEAPDDLTREAVAAAVRQWQFKPATIGGKAVPIRGKLTFYFVIENGKGLVRNPEQFAKSEPAPE